MTLLKKIEEKGLKEKEEILKEANAEVNAILSEAKLKAKKEYEKIVSDETLKSAREIEQRKNAFLLEKRQAILLEQSNQVDLVIDKLRNHLLNLEGEDLLKYSASLIKKETLSGDTIRVSKKDYNKYLTAFSSGKKADIVVLDKLNKALGKGYNLKLESIPENITDGFIVLGKTYDLNFSIEPYLVDLKKKYEKEIFKILF
ncbi:MAG: hypothetical protein ACOX02_02810 [Acholeplasmatales bacterium]